MTLIETVSLFAINKRLSPRVQRAIYYQDSDSDNNGYLDRLWIILIACGCAMTLIETLPLFASTRDCRHESIIKKLYIIRTLTVIATVILRSWIILITCRCAMTLIETVCLFALTRDCWHESIIKKLSIIRTLTLTETVSLIARGLSYSASGPVQLIE
jgi:hypothetical protein